MRLFVYGSLMQGQSAAWRLAEARRIGPARTVDGFALFDLGEFPGMQRAAQGTVYGEIYEIPAELLPALDAYEDYPTLFSREAIGLLDQGQALAYLFRGKTTPDERLGDGRWGPA
ncbi:MAG: gamma-glutamylcyclotransferase [Candidatus Binatia bacterium]|nr:gamma-glutamylcyclotransferase [Candidatus Binatia bacterium]